MNKQKIICIDYDGTYTDFPKLCDTIVITAKKLNMKVIIATMRYEYEEDSGLIEIKEKHGIPVYYTNRQAKLDFLAIKGIKPDLWIDDNPKWVCYDAYKGYIFELFKIGLKAFDYHPVNLIDFLHIKNPYLENKTPLELMENEENFDKIKAILLNIEYSGFS